MLPQKDVLTMLAYHQSSMFFSSFVPARLTYATTQPEDVGSLASYYSMPAEVLAPMGHVISRKGGSLGRNHVPQSYKPFDKKLIRNQIKILSPFFFVTGSASPEMIPLSETSSSSARRASMDRSGGSDPRKTRGGGTTSPDPGNPDKRQPHSGGQDKKQPSGYTSQDKRRQSGFASQDKSKPTSGGQDTKPSSGNQDRKPNNGGQDKSPNSGGQDRKPNSGGQDTKPSSGSQDRKPYYGSQDKNPSSYSGKGAFFVGVARRRLSTILSLVFRYLSILLFLLFCSRANPDSLRRFWLTGFV